VSRSAVHRAQRATRELLRFSILGALGGCKPQLRGHAAANLRVSSDRARQ
jgi:4-carboxymuconolactone decarboxylase